MHYWEDLQSVHWFRCYDNIHVCKLIASYTANAYSAEREMSASACTRSGTGYYIPLEYPTTKIMCEILIIPYVRLLRNN